MAGKIRNCLGVDIGSQRIRISHIDMGKTGPRVLGMIEKDLELDPALNEAQRMAAIAKQLADMVKNSKFRTRKAVFCVPGQTVFVRQFPLPKSTPDRLKRMVSFEARQRVPLPLDKTIMEFQVFESENPGEVYVLLVAIKRDFVMNFMRLVRRSGLTPVSISVSSIALYNFHELNISNRDISGLPPKKEKKPKPEKKKTKKGKDEAADATAGAEAPSEDAPIEDMGFEEIQAYVNIGATLMDLAIPKPGPARMIGFTRSVPLGGTEMDRAVRDKLGFEGLPQARAVRERDAVVLATDFEMEGDTGAINVEASEAITGVADRIISELRRSLDFYISQPDGVAVDSIVLSGGLSKQRYLRNYIEEKMGVPVMLAEARPERLRLPDNPPDPISPYVVSLGLAAQGVGIAQNSVNFLPEDLKTIQGISYFEMAGMAAMLLAIIGLSLNVGSGRVTAYNRARQEVENKVNLLTAESQTVAKQLQDHQKLFEAYNQFSTTAGSSDYWFQFMRRLIEHRPPEILIDELILRVDGNVVIRGKGPNQNSVLQFQRALTEMTKGSQVPTQENPNGTLPVQINSLGEVRDPRYPGVVVSFEILMKTFVQLGRYRLLGEEPAMPAPNLPGIQPPGAQPFGAQPFGAQPYGQPGYGQPRRF